MDLQIAALKRHIGNVSAHQKGFAESLIYQYETKKKLSDKQWFWVGKLLDGASTAGVPDFTESKVSVGSMQGLIDLFKTANKKLKFPAIMLQTPTGQPVKLALAGPNSKTPGYVQVSDGGPWGQNTWFGRVSPTGEWEKSNTSKSNEDVARVVENLLRAMSADPAGTASAHGKLTGRCCFCNKGLEDEKSTSVGYGPVCAKNYGLPWGHKH